MRDQYVSFSDDWRKSTLKTGLKISQGIADANALVATGSNGKLDNSLINWAAPGAIGGTTPAAGRFTTGSFTDSITGSGNVEGQFRAALFQNLDTVDPSVDIALAAGADTLSLGLGPGFSYLLFPPSAPFSILSGLTACTFHPSSGVSFGMNSSFTDPGQNNVSVPGRVLIGGQTSNGRCLF